MVAVALRFLRSWSALKGSLIKRYRGMRRAASTITSMEAWPAVARCMNTAYAKVARPEQARAELFATIALYCAMDMTFWLPQAKEALAGVE
jgi:truncated hemoglobin YjbI